MKIGYARTSTKEQHLDRQLDQLKEAGCERVFQEQVSGATKERPELEHLLDIIRGGDIIVFSDLTRLSRSVKDLLSIVEQIQKKGADIKSLKEPWIDTTTPQGKLLFTFFAGISEFEREIIRQRTIEGLKAARARGHSSGRKPTEKKTIDIALKMYKSMDYTIAEVIAATGISKTTLYRYINLDKQKSSNEQ